jgi:hypothetical protein
MERRSVQVHRRFGVSHCLHLQGRMSKELSNHQVSKQAACWSYNFNLEMEAVRSSETSVNFYQTIRRHIPEDSSLNTVLRNIGKHGPDYTPSHPQKTNLQSQS